MTAAMPDAVGVSPRLLRTGLTVMVAVLLVAGAAAAYRLSTRTTPVTLSQAISRFRSSEARVAAAQADAQPPSVADPAAPASPTTVPGPTATAPAGTGRAVPAPVVTTPAPGAVRVAAPAAPASAPPGVYTYATDGSERVSALGGQSHTYPARTTITVTSTPCGSNARWDPLQQRFDEWDMCNAGSGLQLRRITTYHEFFSQADRRVYDCTPETRFRPDSTVAGTTFGGRCVASGAAAVLSGSVVGVEQVLVGSTPVQAVHVHLDEQLTGATSGTRSGDRWFALADNLLLRLVSTTEADTQTAFGPTHYHETVRLALTDLRPAT
ncbi:MAG: hypothetical protein NVSMB12_18540 [Acidimicrobiales bacterium]